MAPKRRSNSSSPAASTPVDGVVGGDPQQGVQGRLEADPLSRPVIVPPLV